ncbi:MAG: hypothetical protein ACPGSB_00110 [Opitutales bacterium]
MNHPQNKDTIEAITTLHQLNWSKSKISKALGIHRKKIARILFAEKTREADDQDSLKSEIEGSEIPLGQVKLCRNCEQPFIADPRHLSRQKFCSRAECRNASKRYSQRKWSQKNPDYWQ